MNRQLWLLTYEFGRRSRNPALVKEGRALKYFMNTLSIMQFAHFQLTSSWGFQQQPEYKQIIKIMFLEIIARLMFSVLNSTSILTK